MAIINNKLKFVFIHIPKNGGQAISQLLAAPESIPTKFGHPMIRNINDNVTGYFKFAYVRNPWDRLYSLYCYSHNTISKKHPTYYSNGLNYFDDCDFKEWLIDKKSWAGWDRNKDYKYEQIQNQIDYITNNDSKIIIDYVAKFENFELEYIKICKQIKIIPKPIIKKNTSVRNIDYRTAYDNEMIDFVYKNHKHDIEKFNYEYE